MPRKSPYPVQWAAQFYTAAELSRRRYLVTFTLGNARRTDLLVRSPSEKEFAVEVKGQASHNFWIIRNDFGESEKYYFLVYVPDDFKKPVEFFIMTREEMMNERIKYQKHIEQDGGKYQDELGGFNWSTVLSKDNNGNYLYKEKWDKLPS